jgi:phosphoglucosamine mutase
MEEFLGSSGFRGIALEDISPNFCLAMGMAISSLDHGKYAVGHDVRLSSPLLALSLALGLNAGGSDVEYLGLAPTPALAFHSRGKSGGGMITASHNPPEYNGVKLFDRKGASVSYSDYRKILALIPRAGPVRHDSLGDMRPSGGLDGYIEVVASTGNLRKSWRVGLDPGNGSTALTATMVCNKMGLVSQAINLAPDGSFPGRGPEPSKEALGGLSGLVRERGMDVGFAFDGDGDRVAIVDEKGSFIDQDAALAFFLSGSLKGKKGTVIINVDTSAAVDMVVEEAGGRIIRSKVGDPYILEAMLKHRAIAGGESCGAWICPELSLCPDGVLSSVVFLNLLEESGMKPSEVKGKLPQLKLKRVKVPCENKIKKTLMERLEAEVRSRYDAEDIVTVDGVRVSFTDRSWVLARPSGTEPALRITAESTSEARTIKLISEITKMIETFKEGKRRER